MITTPTYLVNEIFETIQGEATYTGTPSIFIRLMGCPVGCHWCDTKHTWKMEGVQEISIINMKAKTEDNELSARMSNESITESIKDYKAKHIVITGGEPCIYDLISLTAHLINSGYSVQIETSGTHKVLCHADTWVTVSPKVDMAGGFKLDNQALFIADEIKYPIGKPSDIEKLKEVLKNTICTNVWLQPISQSKKATNLCIEQATINNWKISIQTHKFLGVR
jgi:7-carboxy-7-deazaguanine synthase